VQEKATPVWPVTVLFGGGGGLVITGPLAMVSVTGVDAAPEHVEFTTVIEAVPALAMRMAGTVAVSCVEETYVVASAVPFQLTVDVETKFVPFTVNVNCGPPGVTQAGSMELIVGAAVIVNVTAFDVVPQELTTVIEAVPGVAIREAGTVAVSRVDETNVVVSAVPFHFTIEVETKFVPFTVNVNCVPPAVAQIGLSEPTVGTALMVNVSGPVPVPLPLVALRVMLNVPATVGVPEIKPVEVFKVKPAGNGTAPHVLIAWSAVIWYE